MDTRLSFSLPTKSLDTRLNSTYYAFDQNQPCTTLVVESVHNHCCSTSVQLLRSRTWRAGLTLVSEGSGSLAKLQPTHEHLHLRSCSHWGYRMSENKRWEVVQQTSSLCVRYIWSQYLTTETQYQTLWSVIEVEDNKHITMITCRNDNANDAIGVRNNWTLWGKHCIVSPLPSP